MADQDDKKPAKPAPEKREGEIVRAVMGTEAGREFVWMLMRKYSINQSPVKKALEGELHGLPLAESLVYHTAQQDVVRGLMKLCADHAPAQFRAMSVESYIRKHEEKQS